MPARMPKTIELRTQRPTTRPTTQFATRTRTPFAAFSAPRHLAEFFVGVQKTGEGMA